jgi:hypothetical protein
MQRRVIAPQPHKATPEEVIDRTGVEEANREDQPDWKEICEADKPHSPMAGMVLALIVEIAICCAGWFILHAWRLL